MKGSELREMTRDELARKLSELKDEQFKLRLRRGAEDLPNPLRLRMLRHDIARCMTVLAEMDRKAATGK
jgi:large subunit ribosomal protein L29